MSQPASDDALRQTLTQVTTATASAMLFKRGYPFTFMLGATPIQRGARICGRAVTLRFGPGRPDLATSEEDRNTKDPMWVAIESLGPGVVLRVFLVICISLSLVDRCLGTGSSLQPPGMPSR